MSLNDLHLIHIISTKGAFDSFNRYKPMQCMIMGMNFDTRNLIKISSSFYEL